ncbi:MAG: HAD-IC family P-type ATPase, partial [Clostridia bacterium]|nr:HAD-IC family P-type ATPase [Clostridia bacterium]
LAASAEYGSNHPISLAISDMSSAHAYPEKVTEESGKGVYAVIENKRVLVGNATLLKEHNVDVPQSSDNCGVFVAVNGRCVGEIILSDTVKSEARDAVKSLKELGAKEVVMLSGDKRETAERVAREIGIDAVCGELLPQDKFDKLQELKKRSKSAVFVGDGINDSPCIASADAGIAMGGIGSDSAIEAADVVIMSDNLNSIPTARRIARKTLSIAKQNIVFALAVKISILILSSFGMGNMWLAVFADVGVAVLAISNSMRAMIVGKRK